MRKKPFSILGIGQACHTSRGLSIIELMVVVAIVGALVAVGSGSFSQASTEAKTASIRKVLKENHSVVISYLYVNGTIPADLNVAGGITTNKLYTISYDTTHTSGFLITAESKGAGKICRADDDLDKWEIDATGVLAHKVDGTNGC